MNSAMVNPNPQIYSEIQEVADLFNSEIFQGMLPPVVFTLQRGKKTMGHFSPSRWQDVDGVTACWRRPNIDPPRRLNIDPGRDAAI
jgi:hypothetical protein